MRRRRRGRLCRYRKCQTGSCCYSWSTGALMHLFDVRRCVECQPGTLPWRTSRKLGPSSRAQGHLRATERFVHLLWLRMMTIFGSNWFANFLEIFERFQKSRTAPTSRKFDHWCVNNFHTNGYVKFPLGTGSSGNPPRTHSRRWQVLRKLSTPVRAGWSGSQLPTESTTISA